MQALGFSKCIFVPHIVWCPVPHLLPASQARFSCAAINFCSVKVYTQACCWPADFAVQTWNGARNAWLRDSVGQWLLRAAAPGRLVAGLRCCCCIRRRLICRGRIKQAAHFPQCRPVSAIASLAAVGPRSSASPAASGVDRRGRGWRHGGGIAREGGAGRCASNAADTHAALLHAATQAGHRHGGSHTLHRQCRRRAAACCRS